jgi:hypothetical protein
MNTNAFVKSKHRATAHTRNIRLENNDLKRRIDAYLNMPVQPGCLILCRFIQKIELTFLRLTVILTCLGGGTASVG